MTTIPPMKHRLLALGAIFLMGMVCWAAPVISSSIKTIRAVGSEGQGNAAAAKAWKQLIKADAATLPRILAAMDGAGPMGNAIVLCFRGVLRRHLPVGFDEQGLRRKT